MREIRNRKASVAAIIFLLLLIIVLNLPVRVRNGVKSSTRENYVPFQSVKSLMASGIRDTFTSIAKARKILRENGEVQMELAVMREEQRNYEKLQAENEKLRKLAEFSSREKHKLILCEVMARNDVSGWWHVIRLNKGLKSGIKPDMAVITMEGLIGRTIEVSDTTSDVLLLTDPTCKVSCRFADKDLFCIVTGGGVSGKGNAGLEMLSAREPLCMDYLSGNAGIEVGDEVVTSGLGGVYPEGLPVGKVSETFVDDRALYQRASVEPHARLSFLRYVFVVEREGGK